MTKMNYNFEWDRNKARTNLSKHKISFEGATSVFKDERAISIADEAQKIEGQVFTIYSNIAHSP